MTFNISADFIQEIVDNLNNIRDEKGLPEAYIVRAGANDGESSIHYEISIPQHANYTVFVDFVNDEANVCVNPSSSDNCIKINNLPYDAYSIAQSIQKALYQLHLIY